MPPIHRAFIRLGVIGLTDFGPRVTVLNLMKPLPYADHSIAVIYRGGVVGAFRVARRGAPDAQVPIACWSPVVCSASVSQMVPPNWQRSLEVYAAEMKKPVEAYSTDGLRAYVALYFREICTRRTFGSDGTYPQMAVRRRSVD